MILMREPPPIDATARETCNFCGGVMMPHWRVCDHAEHFWDYVRCEACGLLRLRLGEDISRWKKLSYAEDYYGEGFSKFTGAIQALREFSAWRRAREIAAFFPQPGRALDIGCGEGLFLKSMKKLGWNVDGCEIGERAAARAAECLSQPIHCGEFETMPLPEKPWDVVMLWHVLEHVAEPARLLENIMRVLSRDGLLAVAIPNAASWQARIFGPHWFHLDPPRHLFSMGDAHFSRLAAKSGWEVVESHHFSLEYNPYGWAQSLLNSLGWKRDAMYERLKRRADGARGGFTLRVLAWSLLGPSIFPAVLEAMARRGGTVSFYLRRTPRDENIRDSRA
ncbi:MAG: class I SAM-dependent methyltransferase [Verrucomicrobia bacterium]|nr:class I SAM-dependent methyltransferase [Verrucomicrobiota bacterium]